MLRRLLARLRCGGVVGRSGAAGDGAANGPELTFFGGKGGVGKTTCAAAYALSLAQSRTERPASDRSSGAAAVLLVSTDPAHSLGDLLELRLDGRPRRVAAGLDALEIDPTTALERYLGQVRANLRELASPELRDAAERQVELAGLSPGGEEAALFDELVRVILDLGTGYTALVFDTAPTGQTLQLLALPEIMSAWTDGMLARRSEARASWLERAPEETPPEDRAGRLLEQRRARYAEARRRLLDGGRTRFVPVLNPDGLSREETRRMVARLAARGIAIDTLIVNRVLPERTDSGFLEQRRLAEARHLAAIDREFAGLTRLRLPLEADEIRGVTALRSLGGRLALAPRSAPAEQGFE